MGEQTVIGLQRLAIHLAVIAASFGAGYALHWHQAGLEKAKNEGVTETVTTATGAAATATDTQAVRRLQSSLTAEKKRSAEFQRQLKEVANAHPADPACRLADGLRDDLNSRLTVD
jgi:hypothetical protein